MNRVILSGRWSRDIELKALSDGKVLCKSSLAVDEGYGDRKQTYFFDVEMWGKTAEATHRFSGKGKRVLLEGRLKVDSWEKDGQKRTAVKIVAEQVEFLERREQDKPLDPFHDDGKPVEIDSDMLPF